MTNHQPGSGQPGGPPVTGWYGVNAGWPPRPFRPYARTASDRTLPLYGAGPAAAFSRFFRNYATFTGCASRSEYWWPQIIIGLIGVAATVLDAVGMFPDGEGNPQGASPVGVALTAAIVLAGIAVVVPAVSLTVRRLHDAGQSGWLALLWLVPCVGGGFQLVVGLLPSSLAGMRYDRYWA